MSTATKSIQTDLRDGGKWLGIVGITTFLVAIGKIVNLAHLDKFLYLKFQPKAFGLLREEVARRIETDEADSILSGDPDKKIKELSFTVTEPDGDIIGGATVNYLNILQIRTLIVVMSIITADELSVELSNRIISNIKSTEKDTDVAKDMIKLAELLTTVKPPTESSTSYLYANLSPEHRLKVLCRCREILGHRFLTVARTDEMLRISRLFHIESLYEEKCLHTYLNSDYALIGANAKDPDHIIKKKARDIAKDYHPDCDRIKALPSQELKLIAVNYYYKIQGAMNRILEVRISARLRDLN